MIWLSAILTAVALTALVAVAASGSGAIGSLRRSLDAFGGLRDDVNRLKRNVQALDRRRRRLTERDEDPA